MANIDFLIIGAQKSGTTSLFKYLSAHPQIYMPLQKEIAFFSSDEQFSKGSDWYYRKYFESISAEKIKGEASPQYMCYDYVPERIYRVAPKVKLIAILRNPIDRAFSHYRMSVRRGRENRSFDESVKQAIAKSKEIGEVDVNRDYVQFGEYGRILQNYLLWFSKNQLKVIFMEELVRNPVQLTQEIYHFLDVSDEVNTKIIGRRYHAGGEKRIQGLEKHLSKMLNHLSAYPWLRRFLTKQRISSILFWIETQYNVKPKEYVEPSKELREFLIEYYRRDVALLEELFQFRTPWGEFAKS